MAGFLKKIFSFGKKEVVETPGLRTDGDELKPIDWAALRDLTKDDTETAPVPVADTKPAEETVARKALEEAQARQALIAAQAEADEKARLEAEADRLAQEQRDAEHAAAVRAVEEAAAKAAQEAVAEQARKFAEDDAQRKASEAESARAAAEKSRADADAEAAREIAARAEAEAAENEKAIRHAAERADATRKAEEAATHAKELAEARAAEEKAARLAIQPEPRFREPPEPDLPADLPSEPELPVELPVEPDLPVEVPSEPVVPETPAHQPPSPIPPDETPEPEQPVDVPPEPQQLRPEPQPIQPPPTAPARAAYNPGLRTGGDELLAPAWMTQPAVQPRPAPPPAPPPPIPSEPTTKVTVAKKVEQKTAPVAPTPEARIPWFQRLRSGLLRSSRELSSNIAGVFTKRKLDEETIQDLEDVLLRADLGLEIAMRVTDTLSANRYGKEISDLEVRTVMGAEIEKVLTPVALPLELDLSHKPHVILVVGVNGTGKTTTIGKLAAKLKEGGLSVMLAAGDTFRAAAIEQLKIWGERTDAPVISSKLGADAAGLAYDAFEQAKAVGTDVLIIDTAGRLQNKTELMAELEKIVRVLGKLDPDAPHTVLQTIDATTGQNALNQVEIFRNVAGVNGLVLTKLDGTARGGILVAIAAKYKLPVYFIGVGEQVDDLEPFVAGDFAKAIAGVG